MFFAIRFSVSSGWPSIAGHCPPGFGLWFLGSELDVNVNWGINYLPRTSFYYRRVVDIIGQSSGYDFWIQYWMLVLIDISDLGFGSVWVTDGKWTSSAIAQDMIFAISIGWRCDLTYRITTRRSSGGHWSRGSVMVSHCCLTIDRGTEPRGIPGIRYRYRGQLRSKPVRTVRQQ